jgi:uncharacterized delta-60 repeat protein
MKKQSLVSIVMLAFMCFIVNTSGFAQTATPMPSPGSFDTNFGGVGTGTLITTVPGVTRLLYPKRARLQSDGKILSLMQSIFEPVENGFNTVLIRYNADGTLDTTFGIGGVLYIEWRLNGVSSFAYDMAIQSVQTPDANGNTVVEERIVVIGSAPALVSGGVHRLQVRRYLPNGTIDTSFGTEGNGRVIVNAAYGLAVAIQPQDQKILTMGDNRVLVRLTANGTPDTTFGVNGVSQADSGVSARALAVQSNGKILAAGNAIARFNSDGTLDITFGKSGKTATNSSIGANDIKVIAGNYILAAGFVSSGRGNNMAVARYTPNGQLDTSFGSGTGKGIISVSPGNDSAKSLDLQSNGKIVLIGEIDGANGYRDFGIARFNANGTIDNSFGQGGKITWDYLGATDDARGVVQPNGCGMNCDRIIAVGAVRTDSTEGNGTSLAAAIGYIP